MKRTSERSMAGHHQIADRKDELVTGRDAAQETVERHHRGTLNQDSLRPRLQIVPHRVVVGRRARDDRVVPKVRVGLLLQRVGTGFRRWGDNTNSVARADAGLQTVERELALRAGLENLDAAAVDQDRNAPLHYAVSEQKPLERRIRL